MRMTDDACYEALLARDARFDGRLFVGVVTTGIYCRPICPARTPRRENVRFFRTAAAAQSAGHRPCLRCRPESSPDLGAWRGTSNTVQRGLTLIEAGALDAADLGAMSDRLGVGERHLRRLFREHLGASPVAVAQTRRVLLAKQLIHETRLPMTEVALAAGFGSVRRFNETFQALYGRPPGALRRAGPERSVASGEWLRLALPYRPPYDWTRILRHLGDRAISGVEAVGPRHYARSVRVDGGVALVRVEPGPRDRLSVAVRIPRPTALPRVLLSVRRLFDLAADPAAIAEHLSRDDALAPLVAARPGLRTPGAVDGFELAVRAVLGQQITLGAARTLACHLVERIGEPLPPDLIGGVAGVTHLFPSAATVAAADLAFLPMPGARIRTLAAVARAAVADPGLFEPGR
ncbi:MAG: DNA-3-methyladenine glycosylase 2 family protein, partial [Caulobacteraceae bacterium]|nr:DNA-3-methyladenine glycosylase 2 family protein [Caulobacteraceae bacterium]